MNGGCRRTVVGYGNWRDSIYGSKGSYAFSVRFDAALGDEGFPLGGVFGAPPLGLVGGVVFFGHLGEGHGSGFGNGLLCDSLLLGNLTRLILAAALGDGVDALFLALASGQFS